MKSRITPVSYLPAAIVKKSLLIATAALMVLGASLAPFQTQPANADNYDQQIKAIQSQIDQFQDQANKLGTQVTSLQAKLDQLALEKSKITAELNLTQARYDQLTEQITATKTKIKNNQDVLGDILADMYIEGTVTTLQMIASSKNIGDFVDKQAYQTNVRQQLTSKIAEVETLKKRLESDQKKVVVVLDRQKAQQESLAGKEAEQASIVEKTKNQQSAYQGLVAENQQRLQSVSEQQRSYYQSLLNSSGGGASGVVGAFSYGGWSGNQGCGAGGYPYCGVQDSYADPWGLYNRECVSYVAWALVNRFDKYVAGFNGQGNAMDWPDSAPRFSGAKIVDSPKAGDAVILPASGSFAPIGHAMIVESVNGSSVRVSQYNFYGTGEYSTMDISTGGVYFIRFQDR